MTDGRLGNSLRPANKPSSPYEDLIMAILGSEDSYTMTDYLPCSPYTQPLLKRSISPAILGSYEKTLLGKMFRASLPVVCITGPMGSGKSTTINFLKKYFLTRRVVQPFNKIRDNVNISNRRTILLGSLDFREFFSNGKKEEDQYKLVDALINEMRARIRFLLSEDNEFSKFWDILLQEYNNLELFLGSVVSQIQARIDIEEEEAGRWEYRKIIYEELKEDQEWYLRYLILLWRYLSDPKNQQTLISRPNKYRITHSIIILDNLDTLPPSLQRYLWDFVLRCSKEAGPTFFLSMRNETFDRLGNADKVFDRIRHDGPDPFEIIIDRLRRFKENPQPYFRGLFYNSEEEKRIIKYVDMIFPEISKPGGQFQKFFSAACGNSIRLGKILAQGLFLLSPYEMENRDITAHYIIRECIRLGNKQYRWSQRSPIENPFFVYPAGRNTILLKIRILRYLYSSYSNELSGNEVVSEHDGIAIPSHPYARQLNELRNDFVTFGYDQLSIKQALNQMMRQECQMIASNGEDLYDETWGDTQELVYLTKIGIGYISELVYSTDFVQEVMLDVAAQIADISIPNSDRLLEKMQFLYRFLGFILDMDRKQTQAVVEKLNVDWYTSKFGNSLVTVPIITSIVHSARNILASSIDKYPKSSYSYADLIGYFESLSVLAGKANFDILGLKPENRSAY